MTAVLENVETPVTPRVLLNVVAPVTPKVLPKVVAPVTPNVPPTVALFVTAKPVPAAVADIAPLNVFAPAIVCAPVVTIPGFVLSAGSKLIFTPEIVIPLALGAEPTAAAVVTPPSPAIVVQLKTPLPS